MACQHCHVIRCGILLATWQTMRILKTTIRHAELLCCVIHHLGEHVGAAGDVLSDCNTRIITRNNGNTFNDLFKRNFGAQSDKHF